MGGSVNAYKFGQFSKVVFILLEPNTLGTFFEYTKKGEKSTLFRAFFMVY